MNLTDHTTYQVAIVTGLTPDGKKWGHTGINHTSRDSAKLELNFRRKYNQECVLVQTTTTILED